MKAFKHSGDLGDVVYSLPALKYLGGGHYYLNWEHKTNDYPGQPTKFNKKGYDIIKPLLEAQDYITEVTEWDGEYVDINFDVFRNQPNIGTTNLARLHCDAFGVPTSVIGKKWLSVDTKPLPNGKSVAFSRSARYHGHLSWGEVIKTYGDRAVFVGLIEEYEAFVNEFNCRYIPYLKTKDLLELAQYINGCELFVGNQSCPFAISQGLGVRNLLEVSRSSPNCNFDNY